MIWQGNGTFLRETNLDVIQRRRKANQKIGSCMRAKECLKVTSSQDIWRCGAMECDGTNETYCG